MANKTVNHALDPFKNADFDIISGEIKGKNVMKEIEKVVEEKRKDIFDILSTGRADGNNDTDEKSLKNMKDALEGKKTLLEDKLGEVITDFDISSNNTNLVEFCKDILAPAYNTKENKVLGDKCANLLEKLQNVYTKGARNEKLFSGKKDAADSSLKDLTNPDIFNNIFNSTTLTELEANIDNFVKKVYNSKDNSFSISKSKLYGKKQAEIATRMAIFLHCMQKALNEGRISDTIKVGSILNKLEDEQIPKIRGLYNLQKEEKAVNAEYNSLVDIRKNDVTDIVWTDTTTSIDLTDSFEGKSTGEAKNIDFYNLNKDGIQITIGSTIYPSGDIVLKDASGEKPGINTQVNFSSGDYTLCLKVAGSEVEIGKLCIDYSNSTKAEFLLRQDPNLVSNLRTMGITGDIKVSIPVMAVKNVASARSRTGQVSLTRNINADINGATPIPPVTTVDDLEINAVVSDMGTDVLKEKVAQDVEEELKQEYKEIVAGNVFKRAYFFLARGKIRQKRIKEKMQSISGKAFTGDSIIDTQTGNAADRHQLEKDTGLNADIKNIDETTPIVYQNPQINDLCKKFLEGAVNENQFQDEFNRILDSDTALKRELDNAHISHMGTNLLIRMKQKLAWKQLIDMVKAHISGYEIDGNISHLDNIKVGIQNYIKTFQDSTNRTHGGVSKDLTSVYDDYFNDRGNILKLNELKNFLSHEQAVMSLATNNIIIKLDIIKGGKSAYQIDNTKREQSWKYKLGHRMDKHPRRTTAGTVGLSAGLGLLTGGLGAIAGAAISTAGFAGIVGTTNAVKKWTHHTKEQNTHEKNLVTDNREELRKIAERQNDATNGKLWKRYKAKRQLALYNATTQSDIKITNIIADDINSVASKIGSLTPTQEDQLKGSLIEGRARLKYYKETGHNFLASDEKTRTEEDMNKLSKALFLGIGRLGDSNLSDIESYSATNTLGRTIGFNDVYDKLKDDYEESDKKFRKERRKLSIKYGVGTALLSAGTAIGMQYLTGTGIFAKSTPGTPGYTSTNTLTDNFDLGKHNLLDTGTQNNIYNGTKSALTGAPSGSTLNISYGAGTDATGFLPGRTPTVSNLTTKITEVTHNINGMSGLTAADKATFISEVSGLGGGTGTNGVLQNMRQAEFLEQAARALSDSGMSGHVSVSLTHNAGLDVVGTHIHNVGERVVNGVVEVTRDSIPGQPPKTRGRWIMGMPSFFNTFKDKKD